MPTNAERLARIQHQLGVSSYGIYLGVETFHWTLTDWHAYLNKLVALSTNKPDYVIVKCGEWGNEWYGGQFPAIRALFLASGIGCVPYFFNRPDTWQQDAAICAKLAKLAGIVILDCEEQFVNHSDALRGLVQRVRSQAGADPVIIVSGYGDPDTAVPNWDFTCLQYADGYQPQWYIGWWDLYHQKGIAAAIHWGDGQIAHRFQAAGLGTDYPIQPATSVTNVKPADCEALGAYLLAGWRASVAVWEAQDITATECAAFRQASWGNHPDPTPPLTPQPTPQPRFYTVRAGDTLSAIATKFNRTVAQLVTANKIVNPNLIFPGQIVIVP